MSEQKPVTAEQIELLRGILDLAERYLPDDQNPYSTFDFADARAGLAEVERLQREAERARAIVEAATAYVQAVSQDTIGMPWDAWDRHVHQVGQAHKCLAEAVKAQEGGARQ